MTPCRNGTTGRSLASRKPGSYSGHVPTTETILVKDLVPGAEGGHPTDFTPCGNELYFKTVSVTSGSQGWELWKSDGTVAGTVMIKAFVNIDPSSFDPHFTNADGELYFSADDGINGAALWKSDGTTAGTALVKDIYSNTPGVYTGDTRIGSIATAGDAVFFVPWSSEFGSELWKTDGTDAGTIMVTDINTPDVAGPFGSGFTEFNGKLVFFAATDSGNRQAIWISDGTAAGTVLVGGMASDWEHPHFTLAGGELLFAGWDELHRDELWKTDGTTDGTAMVVDANRQGTLNVTGDLTDDFIRVRASGDSVIATLNGEEQAFAAVDVLALHVQSLGGNDTIELSPAPLPGLVLCGDGDDSVTGSAWRDTIYGDAGDDKLFGSDSIDKLFGGDGRDSLYGGAGYDQLSGESGNDLLSGGGGKDKLCGGSGRDRSYGGANNDQIDGGPGNDRLDGGAGNDKLFGGSGNDQLTCGGGKDTLIGNKGDDALIANDSASDVIDGSDGNDSASIDDLLDSMLRVESNST